MATRYKLLVIIVLACTACVVFIGLQRSMLRNSMVRFLSNRAAILAENCKSALAFQDAKDAENILWAFHVDSSLMYGTVFDDKNERFAEYYRDKGIIKVTPTEFKKATVTFNKDSLIVSSSIVLDNAIIGTVCLQSDLEFIHITLKRSIWIIIAVLLPTSLITVLVMYQGEKAEMKTLDCGVIQQVLSSPSEQQPGRSYGNAHLIKEPANEQKKESRYKDCVGILSGPIGILLVIIAAIIGQAIGRMFLGMFFELTSPQTKAAIIGGVIAGLLCGLLPYFIGRRKNKKNLGKIAFWSCVVSGAILGSILAAPVAIIFSIVIAVNAHSTDLGEKVAEPYGPLK